MFRTLDNLKINSAEIEYDEVNKRTIVTFQNFKGEGSLKWTAP
ncbi:MAG TPA: hypothetical protein VLN45_06610 [Ignavibacteriaceae bacterium]|nr:hypothetical protein [Ignavibacteriaceae bacterium]